VGKAVVGVGVTVSDGLGVYFLLYSETSYTPMVATPATTATAARYFK